MTGRKEEHMRDDQVRPAQRCDMLVSHVFDARVCESVVCYPLVFGVSV